MQDTGLAYLKAPRFAIALQRWATAEARKQLLEAYVNGMTIEQASKSDRGQVSPVENLRRWLVTSEHLASKLGLDPLSAAKLASWVSATNRNQSLAELLSKRDEHDGD